MSKNPTIQRLMDSLPVWGTALVLLIAAANWAEGIFGRFSPGLTKFLTHSGVFTAAFMAIFLEGLPFLLLGALAAGLVREFFSSAELVRWVPKNVWLGALAGGWVGLFLPVGKAGIAPLTRQLVREGMPVPAGMAMLFAAPALNPVVMAVTFAVFGAGPVFWGRIGLTYLIAVLAGVVFARAELGDVFRLAPPTGLVMDQTPIKIAGRVQNVLTAALDEVFDLGRFLVVGALLAGLAQAVIPTAGLLQLGNQPLISGLGMLLLAVMLSAGATEDAFVVLAYTGIVPTSAILAFLVMGPMADLPQIMALLRILRTRVVVYALLLATLVTLVAVYALSLGGAG